MSSVLLQCYVKPIETIKVLESLEKSEGIKNYALVLYIDKAHDGSKFAESNKELINILNDYKSLNEHKYKEILIFINETNKGPYITCCDGMEYCFARYDFVIFSEDDNIFCKDSIKYFNQYRDGVIPNPDDCLGISSASINFGSDRPSYDLEKDKKHVIESCLLNKIQKINQMSNKQFGMFKNKWDKMSAYRRVSDEEANKYLRTTNSFFMYFSVVPRTSDIGLFHQLGCTTLYWTGFVSKNTIKSITSDDFEDTFVKLEY
jgi:hypothetical protein